MTGRVEGQGETTSLELEEGMATPFLGEGMAGRAEKLFTNALARRKEEGNYFTTLK